MKGRVVQTGLIPCTTCPWRKDQDASTIPGYDQGLAEDLMCTVGEGDALRQVMACHNSNDKKTIPCRGYQAREGNSNINVRILAAKGLIAWPDEVKWACTQAGIKLERNYKAVLAKLTRGIKKSAGSGENPAD